MIDFVIVFIILLVANQALFKSLSNKFSFFDKKLMNKLFLYHLLFFIIYFTYATFNASDSKVYYHDALYYEGDLMNLFTTGTKFILFVTTFLVRIGFSYLSLMFFFVEIVGHK